MPVSLFFSQHCLEMPLALTQLNPIHKKGPESFFEPNMAQILPQHHSHFFAGFQ